MSFSRYASVYVGKRQVLCTKLTTVWTRRHPWQVQKLTGRSIFEREFLLGKNVAAADRMSVVLHSIEFFIRKTRSAQMYKDVHL